LVPWGWICFASPDISGRTSCTFLTCIACIAMISLQSKITCQRAAHIKEATNWFVKTIIFSEVYISQNQPKKNKLSNKFQMKPGGDELHPLLCIVHHRPLHLSSPTSYHEFVYLWVMPSPCQEICVKYTTTSNTST
jgi:hypothetical protein